MSPKGRVTAIVEGVESRLPGRIGTVVRHLRNEDVLMLSAGLAFYALVSVAPFTILVLWLVSLVTGKAKLHEVANRLSDLLPHKLGIDTALRRVADLGLRLGVGALGALVWPATAYGAGLRRSFVRLSGDAGEEGKGIRGRTLTLGLLGVVPALALAGLVAAYAGRAVVGGKGVGIVVGWALGLAFGFAASVMAVAGIYWLFAPGPLGWAAIGRGAVAAAGAISVVSLGYVVFLDVGADFERRYATSGLAAIVLLALWLFLTNAIVLVGFQIARDT